MPSLLVQLGHRRAILWAEATYSWGIQGMGYSDIDKSNRDYVKEGWYSFVTPPN